MDRFTQRVCVCLAFVGSEGHTDWPTALLSRDVLDRDPCAQLMRCPYLPNGRETRQDDVAKLPSDHVEVKSVWPYAQRAIPAPAPTSASPAGRGKP